MERKVNSVPPDFLDAGGIVQLVVDPDCNVTFLNALACELLSCQRAEARGQPLDRYSFSLSALLQRHLQGAGGHNWEELTIRDQSFMAYVNAHYFQGSVSCAICSLLSLEQLNQWSPKLSRYRELKKQLDAIFEYSSDGIWLSDSAGVVLKVNRVVEDNSGFRGEQVIGKSIYQVIDEGLIDVAATAKALETRRPASVLEYKQSTGRTLLITASPVFDEKGELSLIIANERDISQLNEIRAELEQSRQQTERYKEKLAEMAALEHGGEEIIAVSGQMKKVLLGALKLAAVDASNILILGESGTGKGLLARYIHSRGRRKDLPFIQINCAALPENLVESELFGYAKGAFTGACSQGKAGLFELANGGILFLDEIGDLPLKVQAKLLTYLDDHQVMRLGGVRPVKVDCTIIAATNLDLKQRVAQKKFRGDLLYRLSAFTVRIPPLRERPEDLLGLAQHFLVKYNRDYGQQKRLGVEALSALKAHAFPGNVRELKNVLKTAVVMSESNQIDALLSGALTRAEAAPRGPAQEQETALLDLKKTMQTAEKKVFQTALQRCGSTREMARFLGVSQTKVVRSLRKFNLPNPSSLKGLK